MSQHARGGARALSIYIRQTLELLGFSRARGRVRTDDLTLTRRLLWPTELLGRALSVYTLRLVGWPPRAIPPRPATVHMETWPSNRTLDERFMMNALHRRIAPLVLTGAVALASAAGLAACGTSSKGTPANQAPAGNQSPATTAAPSGGGVSY